MDLDLANLETITDFDMGVGEGGEILRVSELPPELRVTSTDINLIIWLLIEQDLGARAAQEAVAPNARGIDSPDASSGTIRFDSGDFQHATGAAARHSAAMRYAEELLRVVGVTVPFQLLSSHQRQELFGLFASSSNLLMGQKFRSILDLYEALRRRSKFREEFEPEEILGAGEFGQVYSVRLRSENSSSQRHTLFALKRMTIKSMDVVDEIRMMVNESEILKKLPKHPNIVQYYNSWLEVDESESSSLVFYLQMELCGMTVGLWKETYPDKSLGPKLLYRLSTELLEALEWIHNHNCIHLDINPNNILWADDLEESVKISDFGFAVMGTNYHGRVGTVPYVAPEVNLNPKSDVYSLGVTLFELSQNFHTRAELVKRIDARNFNTGISFLDNILPPMLRKQQTQRSSARAVKAILQNARPSHQ